MSLCASSYCLGCVAAFRKIVTQVTREQIYGATTGKASGSAKKRQINKFWSKKVVNNKKLLIKLLKLLIIVVYSC